MGRHFAILTPGSGLSEISKIIGPVGLLPKLLGPHKNRISSPLMRWIVELGTRILQPSTCMKCRLDTRYPFRCTYFMCRRECPRQGSEWSQSNAGLNGRPPTAVGGVVGEVLSKRERRARGSDSRLVGAVCCQSKARAIAWGGQGRPTDDPKAPGPNEVETEAMRHQWAGYDGYCQLPACRSLMAIPSRNRIPLQKVSRSPVTYAGGASSGYLRFVGS